jgi:hypothetical protein
MNRRKVEDYAHRHSLSFNEAKRRLGRRATRDANQSNLPVRGMAVAGTGKGGKQKKKG